MPIRVMNNINMLIKFVVALILLTLKAVFTSSAVAGTEENVLLVL